MDQAYFVTASYAVSGLMIGGLALWIFISAKNARQKVEHLEKNK
jgi:heme exporter protein CcmD